MKKILAIGLILGNSSILAMEAVPKATKQLKKLIISDNPSKKQAKKLIKQGAQVDECLFLAIKSDSTKIAKLLIKHCSDLSISNEQGQTPLMYTVETMPKDRRCYWNPISDTFAPRGCGYYPASEEELAPYVKIHKTIILKRELQLTEITQQNLKKVLLCFNKVSPRFIPRDIRMSILCLNKECCRDLATLLHREIINLKIIPVAFHNKLLDTTNYPPESLEQEMIKAQRITPTPHKTPDEIKKLLNPKKYKENYFNQCITKTKKLYQ